MALTAKDREAIRAVDSRGGIGGVKEVRNRRGWSIVDAVEVLRDRARSRDAAAGDGPLPDR